MSSSTAVIYGLPAVRSDPARGRRNALISGPSSRGQSRRPRHERRLRSDLLDAGVRASRGHLRRQGCSSLAHRREDRDAEWWCTVPHPFLSYLHVEISDTEGHIAAGFPFNPRC